MFRPQYWTHGNLKLPDKEVDQVIAELKRVGKELIVRDENISSYHFKRHSRPDKIWANTYGEVVEDITKSLGIYSECQYVYEYWSQLYFPNKYHSPHHHLSSPTDENYTAYICFVHFIKPGKDKNFKFVDGEGKDYTPEQNEGDILCFPPFMWHRVAPVLEERFAVAGNISITQMNALHHTEIQTFGINKHP